MKDKEEMASVLQDASGIKIEPGKRYLIFADPSRVDFDQLPNDPAIVFFPCLPRVGMAVRDSLSAYELEEGRNPFNDAVTLERNRIADLLLDLAALVRSGV